MVKNIKKVKLFKKHYKKIAFYIMVFTFSFAIGRSVAYTVSQIDKSLNEAAKLKDTGWGLCFDKEGETPRGSSTVEELKEFNAYYVGNQDKKNIYLTFDVGYENGNTAKILDALKKHNVHASFFVLSAFMKSNPELVRRMVDEGHIVGNHSFSHPDMTKISNEQFQEEMKKNEELFFEITGMDMPKEFRPPQGKYNGDVLTWAKNMGYKTYFWSLAYVDWDVDKQPSKEEAFDKLLKRVHPGSIVLLHNTSKTNADILDELLTKWEEMGYSFESLENIN